MPRIGAWIEHPQLGVGRVTNIKDTTYIVAFPGVGLRNVESHEAGVREVDAPPQEDPIKRAMREILDEYGFGGAAEIAGRWEGGEIVVRSPSGAQEHRLEVDKLFGKVVMIRDRLRVLEQKVNANKTLQNSEKVDLQQYITRCYGSLTSLNFLFKNDADKFRSSSG
ncbi:MAG: hypothetical protein OER88_07460 [Planctomycetota bacterium]|nr:hypothetical protein [Planctomycetota bacterium]